MIDYLVRCFFYGGVLYALVDIAKTLKAILGVLQ